MATQTLTLGPWEKGLNLISNRGMSTFLDPNELGEAINVIYSADGQVQPRPGYKMVLNNTDATKGPLLYQAGAIFTILGSVKASTGDTVVIVQSELSPANQVHIYKVYSPTDIRYWFKPAVGHAFTHVIAMDAGLATHSGVIFFGYQINTSYRTPDFSLATDPVIIPPGTGVSGQPGNVPASDGGIIVKNRLFLWHNATSRFMWSPAQYVLDWSGVKGVDPATTPGSDTASGQNIDKASGAEDGIMSVEFLNNNFYIFKRDKLFMFTYQVLPIEDSYLRKVSDEGGALSTTMYRGAIVAVTSKGVFRLEGTEFIDLQAQLNLRFEIPIDHSNIKIENIFITDANNDILFGYNDIVKGKKYYYSMNGQSGAWSQWTFDYNHDTEPAKNIAAPGSKHYKCQKNNTTQQHLISTGFFGTELVYSDWKPEDLGGVGTYHLDTNTSNIVTHDKFYIPAVGIKTRANIGGSMLKYKKIHRTYMRFYLSDHPATIQQYPQGLWTCSINYDDYRFGVDTSHGLEQILLVYPFSANLPLAPTTRATVNTTVYKRAYQLPIHQIRAIEFVFELKRAWSTTTDVLNNPDADRLLKQGYFFMLSGVWFDYEDKVKL